MKSRSHRSPRILAALLLAGLLVSVGAQAQPDAAGRLSFSSSTFMVSESAGFATITVLRSNGDDNGNITVDVSASGGTATPGADFTAVNTTLSWPDGDDNSRTFQVPILPDTLAEGNESVILILSNPTGGATLGTPNVAVLDILDDDVGGGGPGTCAASPTALCLKNGRFRVSATFATPGGASGTAQAVPLTGDTGYFWFFNSSNVEMVVKVLDGCPVNNRFWVFAGGLTNVEVRLTVVDTQTGTTKPYVNPLRMPFQPIQDTAAFATCP